MGFSNEEQNDQSLMPDIDRKEFYQQIGLFKVKILMIVIENDK